ncbi:Predicted PurR-regulated permease PerM [Halogranum gelatinilyticum]|uniref:Predicted PurR-regulated permease PerM n=1 Tax=Halogranum gelatinilyticum TaxID=660521 RepID=A0A1G9ZM36_9EURY|nr:AI-2E family transporter [Halogranum gelatinilyticum]SDN22334.1 Predicted PurR-regulated permease PerM [Halogranum gelatinilyticum]
MSRQRGIARRTTETLAELQVGWWAFALVVVGIVAFVGYVYLPWIVFGLFVYYVARPIERRLDDVLPSRNLSALVTLTLVVVPVVTVLGAAVLVTVVELSRFFSTEIVARLDEALPFAVGVLPRDPAEFGAVFASWLSGGAFQTVFGSITQTVGSVAATLFNGFLSLLFAFFLLREDDRLAAWFVRNVAGEDSDVVDYLSAVDERLQSVYFGYTITIFVVMLLATVAYSAFNLVAPPGMRIPAPIPLAVVTGLFTVIPLVGRSIVYFVVAGYLATVAVRTDPTSLWFPLAFLAVMELPFDNLIRVYVRPALSGRLVPMSFIVFAYLLGPPLFGWYGIFYGPLLMVVVVLFFQSKLPELVGRGGDATQPSQTDTVDPTDTVEPSEKVDPAETVGESLGPTSDID